MIGQIKANAMHAVCLVLLGLLVTQTLRLHSEKSAHAQLRADVAEAGRERATAVLKHEAMTSLKEFGHAAATQENSDAFTLSAPVRDAIARVDVARAERMRTDAERRSATYRAQAQACTTASGGIADRLEAFDRHIVEGAAVVAEHRQALIRRDAEVVLLRKQVDADRALMAD